MSTIEKHVVRSSCLENVIFYLKRLFMRIVKGCLTCPCNIHCSDVYCSEQPHKSGGLLPLSLQKKGKKVGFCLLVIARLTIVNRCRSNPSDIKIIATKFHYRRM